MLKKFPVNLKLPVSFALLLMASLAVTLAMFFLQPDTGISVGALLIASRGLTFLLNWLPVALTMLAVFFLCGNLVPACALPALVFLLLSVVNRYMIAMRWAPLRPFDLLLGMEFLGIAKSIKPMVFITAGLGVAAFIALFVVALRFVKNNKLRLPVRLAGFFITAGLMLLLNFTIFTSASVSGRLPYGGSPYSETDQYQSRGFAYSFLYALNTSHVIKPAYYEQYHKTIEAAEQEAADETGTPRQALPNVVMILSEAFSEIPLSPDLNFDGYTDPMAHYKQIKNESVSGYIVSPHIGGGTSDTEFDILTGLNTRDFSGVPYAFSMITRPFPGFTASLKSAGYAALGLHPGAGWFYNRQNVYPLLGFDAFLDDTTYDRDDTRGMYITEQQTISRIIAEYQQHIDTAPNIPFFLDCITIQNHGPYNGKYGAEVNFDTTLAFSADDTDALANYFEGMADCDRELARLVEYFENVDAPTVLVYYGDHLPSFPPSVYQALVPEQGYAPEGEPLIRYNRLPFLVWSNDAAKDMISTEAFTASLPEDKTISAHYLGAAVLEMLGLDGEDPLMELLNTMRADYPIVLEQTWRDAEGGMRVFDAEDAPALALYRSWAYYRVKNAAR